MLIARAFYVQGLNPAFYHTCRTKVERLASLHRATVVIEFACFLIFYNSLGPLALFTSSQPLASLVVRMRLHDEWRNMWRTHQWGFHKSENLAFWGHQLAIGTFFRSRQEVLLHGRAYFLWVMLVRKDPYGGLCQSPHSC